MQQVDRYDRVAVWLHWLVAAMVLVQFLTGWIWGVFERGSEPRMYLFRTHIFVGSAILILACLRLGWRLKHPAPPLPSGMPAIQKLAAQLMHWVLYAAIFVQPALGLVSITAFGKTLGRWPRELHVALTWVILAAVILHIAAALWHQFVQKDRLLERMALRGAR